MLSAGLWLGPNAAHRRKDSCTTNLERKQSKFRKEGIESRLGLVIWSQGQWGRGGALWIGEKEAFSDSLH